MTWMSATTAGAAAAAAAAKEQRREEEEMTRYTEEELAGGWEFKIVRSAGNHFKNRQALRQVIEEQAHAGWVMVEKFSDSRIRFKRPASARECDHLLEPGIDPYRTHYGSSELQIVLAILLVIFGILGVVITLTILAV